MSELTVWKFELESAPDVQPILMPEGARLLSAGEQMGKLCVWALVDPEQRRSNRLIRIAGTGHPLTNVFSDVTYVGRAEFANGALQVHVFDLGPE